MLSRFFNINSKKDAVKKEAVDDWKKDLDEFQCTPRLPQLDSSRIRVLIFKESSSKKVLMFDSSSLVTIPDEENGQTDKRKVQGTCPQRHNSNSPFSVPSQKYQIKKPKADVKTLGEMIFGSVAMVYKGSILKVHLIRSPPQLLMTKVFALRSRSAGVNFCDSEFSSCNGISKPVNVSTPSLSSISVPGSPTSTDEISRSFSTPIGIKTKRPNFMNPMNPVSLLVAPSWSTSDLDSLSLSSSMLSLNASPIDSSAGSFRHRFSRSKKTSLDSSVWRSKSEQSEELRSVYKQQPKIGVGIIFNLWDNSEDNRSFQNFFFSHHTLFEAQLQAFRCKIEKSFYLRQKFLDTAVEAVEHLKNDILTLCYAPRIVYPLHVSSRLMCCYELPYQGKLPEPVWLNLNSTGETKKQKQCAGKFMKIFLELYDLCENKESSYFLSNLVTGVLTHHLSWVNTVISSEKNSVRLDLNKRTSSTIDVLAKCHPYNPLWAQICDLYGCLGSSFKLARTVVVGKDAKLVNKFLEFLTYFIRCCEVKENSIRMEKERNVSNRHSGSNWSDSVSKSNSNSNIHSWFERSCNVISLPNETQPIQKMNDPFKDFKSYCHLDALEEQDECCVTPRTTERNIIERLKSMNIDTSSCYCVLLQALNRISDKSLRSYVNMEELKIEELQRNENNIKRNGLLTSKCCMLCRTLEKGMFDEFCDRCKLELEKLSIEVDMVCLHCVKRLEVLKSKNKYGNCACGKTTIECLCNSNSTELHTDRICPKRPSFTCYCCGPSTYGNLHLELKVDTSQGSSTDLDLTPRPRKSSDPIDCIPNENNGSNFNKTFRNSTNSHDSGTEMECSIGSHSCAGDSTDCCLTRTNSLSSQGVVTDLDSDYCSVENEQLGTTLNDINLEASITPTHDTVSKSLSDNTLKSYGESDEVTEVQEVSIESLDEDSQDFIDCEEEDILASDLKDLRLTELSLPNTQHKAERLSRYPSIEETPSFGKSMFAGYSEEYMSDFVLQGCQKVDQTKLANDLLKTVKYSVLDEEIRDAVCIVADTDNWSCEVRGMSKRTSSINQSTCCEPFSSTVYASTIVTNMIESTKDLCSLDMPANFCLLHIEEQLRDLFNKGKVFAEYSNSSQNDENSKELFRRMFGYHSTDIDLLTAVGDSLKVPIVQDMSLLA